MVVRGGEKALVGWATTKSGDTAPATVVDGSQTSHSLQLAVRTELRTKPPLISVHVAGAAKAGIRNGAVFVIQRNSPNQPFSRIVRVGPNRQVWQG